MLITKLVEEMK